MNRPKKYVKTLIAWATNLGITGRIFLPEPLARKRQIYPTRVENILVVLECLGTDSQPIENFLLRHVFPSVLLHSLVFGDEFGMYSDALECFSQHDVHATPQPIPRPPTSRLNRLRTEHVDINSKGKKCKERQWARLTDTHSVAPSHQGSRFSDFQCVPDSVLSHGSTDMITYLQSLGFHDSKALMSIR